MLAVKIIWCIIPSGIILQIVEVYLLIASNKKINVEKHTVHAWFVPLILMVGIVLVMIKGWPIYVGIVIGYVGAVLYALAVGSTWREVHRASMIGMQNMWRVCVVLLLVGVVIALWMVDGTIPTLTAIGSDFIRPSNVIWIAFLMSAVLSMIIGSSLATWGILGPPMLALTPPHLLPVVAGALVSGGMVGDRSSPMSTSVIIMSKAADLSPSVTLRQLLRTAILPVALTLLTFSIYSMGHATYTHMPVLHHVHLTQVTFLLIVPPILVIILAALRIPLLYNLIVAVVIGSIYATKVPHESVQLLASQLWRGYPLVILKKQFYVGGLQEMVQASLLIVTAGAFQGVTALGGAIELLIERLFARVHKASGMVVIAYGISIAFAMLMGSQSLATLMSGNTLLPQFARRNIDRRSVLRVIGDSSELVSAIVPWNLLGLQAGAILGISTLQFVPYAYFIYFALIGSIVMTWRAMREQFVLPSDLEMHKTWRVAGERTE